MGFFASLTRALGWVPPIEPREPGPLAMSARARDHIASLQKGVAVNVATAPAEGGRVVAVQEGPALGTVFGDLGVVIRDADRQAMRGLVLDWDGQRWSVQLNLRVEPGETPNPDGRLYEVDRPLARGRPRFFKQGAPAPALAQRLLQVPGVNTVLFRDHTVTIERTPGHGWPPIDRAVDAALREHFLLCGEALPPGADVEAGTSLEERLEVVLREKIAPAIHKDGGDIQLVSVDAGVVRVLLVGACRTCPAASLTLKVGVEKTLREAFPDEVYKVEAT